MKLKKYFYLGLITFIFAGCGSTKNFTAHTTRLATKPVNESLKHTVVVFVHGTILPLPSPSCIFPSIKDVLKKGRSTKMGWSDFYYEKLRYKTFFKYQLISNCGLENIDELSAATCARYPYTMRLANFYQNSYEFSNEKSPTNLHLYNFGWDGRLCQKSRIRGAKNLYKQLTDEVVRLKKEFNLTDDKIETILIGHSHGGNVLLNLVHAEEEFKQNLKIDKLILVGTPVQSETASLITNPMFKKVYSFYSNGDYVQVVDFVSTDDSISKRRYNNNESGSRLTQIELAVDKTKPSHSELWLHGNSSNFLHRKSLSTYPYPLFLFIPIIINTIEEQDKNAHEMFVRIHKDKVKQVFEFEMKNKGVEKALEPVVVPTSVFEIEMLKQPVKQVQGMVQDDK